ncbi:hypothetical protein [Sphingomonas sp. 37zxx]|uniref:hypothetical protein n=1 Tax=Sphingomonas sp. 37zxx TaxID=1550073 RepID=UPI00053BE2E4|nr:hypothetical protein [Sphingomonas sp. 37zxx]
MRKIAIGVMAMLAGSGASANSVQESLCARLAPQIGLSPTSDPKLYQGRLVNGLKGALIGGTGSIAFQVEPTETTPIEDQAALQNACQIVKGNFRCAIDRPMILTISTNKGDGRVEVAPGEKALIETKGVRVRCTDGIAA